MLHRIKPIFARYRTVLGILILMGLLAAALSSATVSATEQGRTERNIQLWVSQLNSEQPTPLRLQAEQQLERAGDPAIDALTASLASSNPVLRRNAAEVLGYIASPRSARVLRDTLAHDPNPAVRTQVVWALSELNSPAEANLLERASILDQDSKVRKAAVDALDGLRWSMASLANQDVRNVRAMQVAPNQPDFVYLAVADEMVVSTNGGKSWNEAAKMPTGTMALAVNPSNPYVVYAGMEMRGIYKSDDGGSTWTNISETLGEAQGMPVSASALTIDSNDPDHLYAAKATWIGTSQARLFPLGIVESHDGGKTWTPGKFPKTQDVITRLLIDGDTLYGLAGANVVMQTQ